MAFKTLLFMVLQAYIMRKLPQSERVYLQDQQAMRKTSWPTLPSGEGRGRMAQCAHRIPGLCTQAAVLYPTPQGRHLESGELLWPFRRK